MPRRRRVDYPGAWLHLIGRGLARRTVFESEAEFRFFLACLACVVRRGEIEIHAFVLLQTHYRLLVRSPVGCVSHAMQWLVGEYTRYFNRTRRRDGPLWRGRFYSRLVDSHDAWCTVIGYID